MRSRIVGIDPGLGRMGYGVVDADGTRLTAVAYGCFETPAAMPLPDRLLELYNRLSGVLTRYQPQVAAVEELFFYRNTTTAFAVGQARGVAVLAAVQAGLRVAEYTPLQVKQAVSGYGKADKHQVQEMVRLLLQLPQRPTPDDAADALAVAICHAHAAPLAEAVVRTLPPQSGRWP
ncbi:MAG: crossover junction endodeoxyribonuclease RuvC [Alicyclobacillus sp.]|nr:crossover junction endodeoxyribonuclease RuvC [Alicyclobacillus sp.]